MCDIFLEDIPDWVIAHCFAVCALTPHLTHMFLTKRPARMLEFISLAEERVREAVAFQSDLWGAHRQTEALGGKWVSPQRDTTGRIELEGYFDSVEFKWPLPNVMLGASAENQKYFDERIPYLSAISGWRKFLSLEPLLGPINTHTIITPHGYKCTSNALAGISLAITGGESGRKARPMLSKWAADIGDQVQASGVSFFHKQNGEYVDAGHEEFGRLPEGRIRYLRSDGTEWPMGTVPWNDEDADVNTVKLVGKKRAGNTLYGKVYHQFPTG
jgi:protein gp37